MKNRMPLATPIEKERGCENKTGKIPKLDLTYGRAICQLHWQEG
jgi:hypothetical protein